MVSRLKGKYLKEIAPALKKEFSFTNLMQIPKLSKVVVNIGVGGAVQDIKELESATGDLSIVTGQKPIIRRARKSISNFKLRA